MLSMISICANDVQGIRDVYQEIKCLDNEYPNFSQWFYGKVVPGLVNHTRVICIVKDEKGTILGVLITKNDGEKKICTLRVASGGRRQGIGRMLLEESFKILNTNRPMITVSQSHISEFKKLLGQYHFKLKQVYYGYYSHEQLEYSYNGLLNQSAVYRNASGY